MDFILGSGRIPAFFNQSDFIMRVGLLQCDDVLSSLSTTFGEYPDMIAERLSAQNDNFEFQIYKTHEGVLPDSIDECDAYVITGSRHSLFEPDLLWVNSLIDFVVCLNKAKIKTIGLSFGHQVMAEAMGGKVERVDSGWLIGAHEMRVVSAGTFMQPSAATFRVAMMCEDQVQAVGEEAIVLAQHPKCEYGLLQYGEHMLSIQGHPEFSAAFAKSLLNICQEQLPSKRYEKGSKSLSDHELDGDLIFQWFAQFLTAGHSQPDASSNTARPASNSAAAQPVR